MALLVSSTMAPAQTPVFAPEARAVSRGPHETVWAWTTQVAGPDGQTREERHSFIQLQTGLNRWTGSQYEPAQVEVEIFPGGAVSQKTAHRVIFPPQTPGEIDLEAPDGRRMRTQVLGLALVDTRTGESALIAEPKECAGQVLGSDTVIYVDAFDAIKCDVRYTVSLAGVEQDILIREYFSPKEWGFEDEQAVRVEVITEFLEQEDPLITQRAWPGEAEPQQRQALALPEVVDQTLDFGAMSIGSGQAFSIGGGAAPPPVPVAKGWHQLPDNRRVLIESVDYSSLQPLMRELPQAAAPTKTRTAKIRTAPGKTKGQLAHAIPSVPPARKSGQKMLLAQAPLKDPAVVIDYSTLSSSVTNYVFEGTNTYYITGPVYLYGSGNRIIGGSVLKFNWVGYNACLDVKGQLVFETDLYRPATLTACADSSVGEQVYAGAISGYYADPALRFDNYTSGQLAGVSNVVIRYAKTALKFFGGRGHEARHLSLISCDTGVDAYYCNYALRNLLGRALNTAIYASGANTCTGVVEHATLDYVYNALSNATPAAFTNCLLTFVVNTNGIAGLSNVMLTSANGVFKGTGAAFHYLADASPYRDAGTTNINPALAAELKLRTTYGPVVLSNIAVNTLLSPQAARDTDLPDLGYHAPPLDFLACGVGVADGVTVVATNGVAIGIDYTNSAWGFMLTNAKFLSVGSPLAPNRIVRGFLAQEYGGVHPASRAFFYDGHTGAGACQLRLRFTECVQGANDGPFINSGQKFSALEVTHSRLYNPSLVVDTSGSLSLVCGLTNNLWESGLVQLGTGTTGAGVTVHLQNNLFRRGVVDFYGGNNNWTVRDNLFESMYRLTNHSGTVQNGTNAYYATAYGLSGGVGNISLGSLSYQAGPLGRYYYASSMTSLIDKGSCLASNVGLYHFTTATNQVKEAGSRVDIGLHYVALNASGSPLDLDTPTPDGIPDYLEDQNGDGLCNAGETDWTSTDSDGDGLNDYLEMVRGMNPLDADSEPDTTDLTGLRVYTPLK